MGWTLVNSIMVVIEVEKVEEATADKKHAVSTLIGRVCVRELIRIWATSLFIAGQPQMISMSFINTMRL